MSAQQIDVLAVMDEAARTQAIREDRQDMREALAAVSELIEADKEYDRAYEDARLALPGRIELTQRRFREASARRSAALASVGGAQ